MGENPEGLKSVAGYRAVPRGQSVSEMIGVLEHRHVDRCLTVTRN